MKLFLIFFLIGSFHMVSQKPRKDTIPDKPQRAAFESSFIIDNPTDLVFPKKSLEMQIKHRFGLINSGQKDLLGLWGMANIRIGLAYSFHDLWTIGFGTSKLNKFQDFNLKIPLLRQTRSDKTPFNISYYGSFTIDARDKSFFELTQDRFSFFNQLIISRRFSSKFSFQVAPSISHFNLASIGMENDIVGIALGGRYKLSPQTAFLVDYSHPFTNFGNNLDPEPGLSFGVEFATLGHAFQILISNYDGIVPQQNYTFNKNDFFQGDILIGFNITRIYKFN